MPLVSVRPDTLCAWSGPSLLVVNTRGECGDDQRLAGYYFREARYLRTLQLRINGRTLWPCEASSVAPDTLSFTYVHPETAETTGGGTGQGGDDEPRDADGLPERGIDIRVTYVTRVGSLDVRVELTNRWREKLALHLSWICGADFADIQEADSGRREQKADVRTHPEGSSLTYEYGHPQLSYRTTIVSTASWRATGNGFERPIELEPQQRIEFGLHIKPFGSGTDLTDEEITAREAAAGTWRAGFARIEVPRNRVAEAVVADNIRDFGSFPLLDGRRDEWLALQAGMPLYPALFGRDALTAGWQAAIVDRGASLSSALTRLGRMQSDRFDDWRDEEPGRIPYQSRSGPLARLNINPYAAYYADFASPLMFVISLANLYGWVGEKDVIRRHWDTARRLLDWAREYGDRDRDGYLEYQTRSPKGTKNQGWKDSGDAIVYDDGTHVPEPIGTCELQGYWYIAQLLMGALAFMSGERRDATAYWTSAADLKARFNRDWWMETEGFFALALDRNKRLVRAITSNVGHCLATGIIDSTHLSRVVGRLFAPDMFSGWGIRTLSSSHKFYNPLSYHRGTVWAVEQGTILFGLRRFGFDARAHDLASALFDLAQLYPDYRIPECVGGYARAEVPTPGAYPRANTPQLWNATALPLTMQVLLGILPLAPFETLVVDPSLPEWLPEVVVRDLRVGEARVTLRCWRNRDAVSHFEVLHKVGTLHVVRQPPPEAIDAGLIERTGAVAETVLRSVS